LGLDYWNPFMRKIMARDKNQIFCRTDGFSFFALSAENEKYFFFSLRSLRLKRVCERAVIFIFLLLLPISIAAQANDTSLSFRSIAIEAQFHDVLIQHPEFMKEGGAKVFSLNDGSLALIGIGKVFPENNKPEAMLQERRKGEILARSAVLALGGDVEISAYKGLTESSFSSREENRISLSSFFQVTETRVEGEVQQLPVVGTWWSTDYSILYVAVGKIVKEVGREMDMPVNVVKHNDTDDMPAIEGGEPFVSLLQASPLLRQNGGVRGFILDGDRKVLISVASALLNGSYARTRRVAQLKAVRSLLGHQEGIKLSAVEYLEDREHLRLSEGQERRMLISHLLSVHEERVSGIVKALPIVIHDDINSCHFPFKIIL
jgi:hypothetical protein